MERELIIPTRYKRKIPRALSYPVGAKIISQALAGVPQFAELRVEFHFWNRLASRPGAAAPYDVIKA